MKSSSVAASIDRNRLFLAVLCGLLLTGSFPSVLFPNGSLDWVAWFALVPLLFAIKDLCPKDSFKIGILTGVVHYITLLYWIIHNIRTYGNLPIFLCVPILILLSLYLSLYIAFFSYGLIKICSRPLSCLFVIPIIWVVLEYIRSYLVTGFPWELLGYSQFGNLRLIQISDIFGVYGVSFLVAYANGVIFLLLLNFTKNKWAGVKVAKPLVAGSIISFALLLCVVIFYGNLRLKTIDQLILKSSSKNVTVIQGNIPQEKKWDPAFQDSSIWKYSNLSFQAKKHNPDLIVWPETATPFYYSSEYFPADKRLTRMVQKTIRKTGAHFLIGSPSCSYSNMRVKYFNSAFFINPMGKTLGRYDKVHLVPFGEYVPFGKLLWFVKKMVESVGDFSLGKKGHVLEYDGCDLGIQICYEIIFPDLSRAFVKNNAGLIVNITNDAWFGNTSAPYQHFSMAVFRAVENKRSVVRAANTGISGFVDPAGRITGKTSLFESAELTQKVPILSIKTQYTRIGDLFAIACVVATLLIVLLKKTGILKKQVF
jgi:apolipoprotein N-acyltransferase